MGRRDAPVLIQAAIAHAQFETIHPFADSNGRTGRALVYVILRERGLTTATALPTSEGLLGDVEAYFASLDAYRRGDADPIVNLFAQEALDAVARGEWLAAELNFVRAEWGRMLTARTDALTWQVLPLLVQRPVLTTSMVSAQLDKRRWAWRSPEVLALLDEFAALGGWRG